jgi:hypothetical protein
MILIVTSTQDLHALMIQRELLARGERCALFETDAIANTQAVSWRFAAGRPSVRIRCAAQDEIDLADVTAIWWRRPQPTQRADAGGVDAPYRELVDTQCRAALSGMFSAHFSGQWVSSPDATSRASDKLLQLSVAARHGLRVPRTVVTQRKQDVLDLYAQAQGRIIVKSVVGVREPMLFTRFVQDPDAIAAAAYAACPAMYQEYIPGCRHIRLNCFGAHSYAAAIDTDALDWRADLTVPVTAWDVPAALHAQVRAVLDELGLAMGAVDLKLTPQGEFVWLEVNPQGQFLFLEPLTGQPLTRYFTDYLIDAARTGVAAMH